MILPPALQDAIADQFTLAANGEDVMACYCRTLDLLAALPETLNHPEP